MTGDQDDEAVPLFSVVAAAAAHLDAHPAASLSQIADALGVDVRTARRAVSLLVIDGRLPMPGPGGR